METLLIPPLFSLLLLLQCCKSFPPVFRHFFLEAFLHPADWFEARTRYTRSTAVASMAGAVIGLGDRHLGNILLDMHTAEVCSNTHSTDGAVCAETCPRLDMGCYAVVCLLSPTDCCAELH